MGVGKGAIGNWSLCIWGFCFAVTLVTSIAELCKVQSRFPFLWNNFAITYACYLALVCLSISITYSVTCIQSLPYGPHQDRAVTTTAFSCLTSVLYAMEVACTWSGYKITNTTCYVLTVPGLLKVLETFMAGVIFAFLGNTSLYLHQPALEWCVAVHSICFILAAVTHPV